MSRPRALAALIQPIARRSLGKANAGLGALLTDWEAIAGADLAGRAAPERLSFPRGRRDGGTLILRAAPADALEIQHDAPRILERINGHFGYRAIEDLKLVQAPPPARKRRPAPRPLSPTDESSLEAALSRVDDPDLRARLASLGRSIFQKSRQG